MKDLEIVDEGNPTLFAKSLLFNVNLNTQRRVHNHMTLWMMPCWLRALVHALVRVRRSVACSF